MYRLSEYKKYKAAADYLKKQEAEAGTYYTNHFRDHGRNLKIKKKIRRCRITYPYTI
ncbi:hypothetical protein [Sinobaca sp. H24]|uniref:hypothetical protein n=1 Tax=Sinobaca sp. H24 TaxID=2923376 RepID=UPI00207AEE25|nr:hypothetical protein [Sinobaca sp. H24]